MSSFDSNSYLETSAPLINVVSNAAFHSNAHINQMLPQIIHILHFISGKSNPHITEFSLSAIFLAYVSEQPTNFCFCFVYFLQLVQLQLGFITQL